MCDHAAGACMQPLFLKCLQDCTPGTAVNVVMTDQHVFHVTQSFDNCHRNNNVLKVKDQAQIQVHMVLFALTHVVS